MCWSHESGTTGAQGLEDGLHLLHTLPHSLVACRCVCSMDGWGGAGCAQRFEMTCVNQCSGHGECYLGFCKVNGCRERREDAGVKGSRVAQKGHVCAGSRHEHWTRPLRSPRLTIPAPPLPRPSVTRGGMAMTAPARPQGKVPLSQVRCCKPFPLGHFTCLPGRTIATASMTAANWAQSPCVFLALLIPYQTCPDL